MVRNIRAVYQFMRFEEKRDAEDVSKQKKKNFNKRNRKRPFLSHWCKAVFGGAGIKKAALLIARLFLIDWFGGPRPTLHIYLFALSGKTGQGVGLTFAFLIFSGYCYDIVRGSHYSG